MMTNEYRRPLPKISETTRPFWEGCKRHELLIQRCGDCGTYRFPPRPMCPKCNSMNSGWSKVSGKGEIFSFIVVPGFKLQAAPMGSWPEDGYPINVVIVELPDAGGVHIVSNLVECRSEEIKVGMPVKVVFEDVTEEITLPKFRPA